MSDDLDGDFVGDLIPFPKAPDDTEAGPLKAKRRDRYPMEGCKHPRPLVLDQEAHELRCGECGQTLDIFDFLFDLTGKWELFNRGYRAARQQERATLARLENLKRLERNAKARIRKGGVVLTSAQARVVRSQLVGLQGVAVRAVGSVEETRRLARLNGVDEERLVEALALLREQLDLDREAPEIVTGDDAEHGGESAA